MFSQRTLSVATILVILGAIAGGTWWRLQEETGDEAAATASQADTSAVQVESASTQFASSLPTAVEGAEVLQETLWITVDAAGQAAANRRTVINAQVEGVIQTVPVRENSRIAADQTLVQIDTVQLALAVARSRAQVADAQANFDAQTIFDDRIQDEAVRRQRAEVLRSSSGLNSAEVDLRSAEIQLSRSRVAAPWGGRVANLNVAPGQYVTAGTELLTVVDLDPIKVEVQVLEAELGYLAEGRRARVSFAAFPDEVFQGSIATINPLVDPELRTGRITVLLPNPDGRIKPGMYADVSIDARAFENRVIVPRSAVLERGNDGRKIVFLFNGEGDTGRAQWQYVNTGEENNVYVELLPSDDGVQVQAGQIVLVDGHHYLAHDTAIRLVENAAAEGGRPAR